ncbi:MAG: cell division protein FtsK [Gammaproteobacteria bacterium]|nr:MAG: cell division protein FtsK [Gammaproteobacteria bacterium]TLZ30677.1 MAG: cell division protein FtsK [Gammaproteobacteria bacterium]TLZ48112.1 MAG: cell division protein FtsK [Gammaproteobacteria bacterium]
MGLAETSASARAAARYTSAVTRGLRESAIIALGIVALVLLIALLTYSPDDPGFSFTGNSAPVRNRIGVIGAWLADVLFFLFGRPAFLFPLVLGAACWGLQRRMRTEGVSRANTLVRIAGFVLVLVASCGLTTLHWQPGALRQTAGGVVGSVVGGGLVAGLDFLGATLVMLAAWMAGLSLAFGVSWLTIMDRLGTLTWAAIGRLRSRWAAARDVAAGRERRQARKEAMESEQKRSATRSPPRIEPPLPLLERSARVERERQVPLFDPPKASELPPLKLLDDPPPREPLYSAEALEALSRLVEMKLKDFTIEAEVVAVQPGPVVTRFELRPAPGVKASQITALAKDLARALSVLSVRVVEVIPGKSVMGLEIANEKREVVTLGEIIRSRAYDEMHSPLALALGKDIGGQPVVADLSRMPHLLIAGTTGSGKSVALNAMVLSLLYKSTAEHVRLIMIDPKMLELSVYEGIPHLLAPVVTDMKQAANALRWCVAEMDRRHQLMAALGVRNIAGFNRRVKDASDVGRPIRDPVMLLRAANDPSINQTLILDLAPLPYVVVVVDEFADLMMIVGKKVEELITRLAQKARASGIHLVLATQRPSVDVITGLIKANIPCRIAFQVSARVDSRTILDQMGAETLLGHGDMLYLPPGTSLPTRVHGAFVSDQEVHRVVEALKTPQPPSYIEEVLSGPKGPIAGLSGEEGESEGGSGGEDAEQDPLYDEAVRIVTTERKPSISYVQRRLKIGYNRAARLLEGMEQAGLVGPLQTNGARDVLAPAPPEE